MKKIFLLLQPVFLVFFFITLFAGLFINGSKKNILSKYDWKEESHTKNEAYDTLLARLNTIEKVSDYCDSIYKATYQNDSAQNFERRYTELVDDVFRKRFYHGYSFYKFSENYLLVLFSKITDSGYSAIIAPEDIMKRDLAACSQQTIVMMEVLKKKNIATREVGFTGKLDGHLAFEVYFDSAWHYYDSDLEPDKSVLIKMGLPSIENFEKDTAALMYAYRNQPRWKMEDVLPHYFYGIPNKFIAPRGLLLQEVTKFLSKTLWLFLGIAFLFVRYKYKKI